MALRVLLCRVACISFLLDISAGFAGMKGKDFRTSFDSKNLQQTMAHDLYDFASFMDNEASNAIPATNVDTGLSAPVVHPLNLIPTAQPLPNTQNAPDVEKILNAGSNWASRLSTPITFPQGGNWVAHQIQPRPDATQPQSTPLVSTSSKPVSQSLETRYKPAQSPTSMPLSATGFESWLPAGAVSNRVSGSVLGSRFQLSNSGSSGGDSSNKPLVQGFQHGSRVTGYPDSPSSNAVEGLSQESAPPLTLASNTDSHSQGNDITPPRRPSLRYPVASPRPQNYAAEGSNQGNDIDAGSSTAHTLLQTTPVHYPSVNARPQTSASNAFDMYHQGNIGIPSAYNAPRNPSLPIGAGVHPFNWMTMPYFNIFGDGLFGFAEMGPYAQNWQNVQHRMVPQQSWVPQQTRPPAPRKGFFVKHRNAYQRGRHFVSKTTYTPNYLSPEVKDSQNQ